MTIQQYSQSAMTEWYWEYDCRMDNLQTVLGTVAGYNNWVVLTEFKHPDVNGWPDFRFITYINKALDTSLYWSYTIDRENSASNGHENVVTGTVTTVPVPVQTWFKVQLYCLRGDATHGRIVLRCDGQTVFDWTGQTYGFRNYYVARLFPWNLYSGGGPHERWITNFSLWSTAPAGFL
jgi:hypothetical protein